MTDSSAYDLIFGRVGGRMPAAPRRRAAADCAGGGRVISPERIIAGAPDAT